MIKTIAALFMLIDHVGLILFPQSYILRIIGRVSMPMFAFCVAQGFYYSEKNGTTQKYAKNLLIFAAVSQIPYAAMVRSAYSLNIGFTWLLALCLMKAGTMIRSRRLLAGVAIAAIAGFSLITPVSYGLYGVLYPSVFYLFLFRWNKGQYVFLAMAVLFALYAVLGGGVIQAFALAAWPVLAAARRYDHKIKLPRSFFYCFYPAHIAVLLILRSVLRAWL